MKKETVCCKHTTLPSSARSLTKERIVMANYVIDMQFQS